MIRHPLIATAAASLLAGTASADTLRERLRGADVDITEIEELGTFIFWDNNGIMLEATWPAA